MLVRVAPRGAAWACSAGQRGVAGKPSRIEATKELAFAAPGATRPVLISPNERQLCKRRAQGAREGQPSWLRCERRPQDVEDQSRAKREQVPGDVPRVPQVLPLEEQRISQRQRQ
jgi:hypothetical protein